MGDLSPDIGVKLGRLVPMLSSPVAGEVVATVAAIGRTLDRAGMDWHDLAKGLMASAQSQPRHEPPPWQRGPAGDGFAAGNAPLRAMADWLDKYALERLTDRQRDFVANVRHLLASGRRLTSAQKQYLADLHTRHGGEHA
ncbi:hypothetical protein [Sandarakinorhabdus sp.]|uniref:hypothetical protein n=1 Tax=Sandarakinorhabdus sp. TaxID=1916663 RepID=UPI003F7279E6